MAEQLSFGLIVTDPEAHRQQLARKSRRCLSCDSSFQSTGPGNRICSRCKSTEAFHSSPDAFSIHIHAAF
jgi:hypothetical protein